MSVLEKIKHTVTTQPVVLYMKGTADAPRCGFSGQVVQILQQCGIKFVDVNVLDDPEIRQGIKDYADWPTIPQLYINGQFIGGCDIVSDMYQSGELQELLKSVA